jgi:ferredoxin-type protein NapF
LSEGRRDFFKSLGNSFVKKEDGRAIIRPPYFLDAQLFAKCTSCDAKGCQSACDEKIIFVDKDVGCVIDFSQRGCTFCDKCAIACDMDVLKVEHKQNTITQKIVIDMIGCMSWNDTICFSCKDVCYDNAIDFFGMFRPTINQNCTSCGFCVGVCPSGAIKIKDAS